MRGSYFSDPPSARVRCVIRQFDRRGGSLARLVPAGADARLIPALVWDQFGALIVIMVV